jgi:hypothetical protein
MPQDAIFNRLAINVAQKELVCEGRADRSDLLVAVLFCKNQKAAFSFK